VPSVCTSTLQWLALPFYNDSQHWPASTLHQSSRMNRRQDILTCTVFRQLWWLLTQTVFISNHEKRICTSTWLHRMLLNLYSDVWSLQVINRHSLENTENNLENMAGLLWLAYVFLRLACWLTSQEMAVWLLLTYFWGHKENLVQAKLRNKQWWSFHLKTAQRFITRCLLTPKRTPCG